MINLGTIINFIKWLIITWKGDTKIKFAKTLLGFGFLLIASSTSYTFVFDNLFFNIDNSTSTGIVIFGAFLSIVGIAIALQRFKELEVNPPYILYVRGMTNMDDKAPRSVLPLNDLSAKDMIYNVSSYDKNSVIGDYAFIKRTIFERIEHSRAPRLYVAALGSFPLQYLIGTLIRNAHSTQIHLLDFDRFSNKWYLLEEFDKKPNLPFHIHDNLPLDTIAVINSIISNNPQEVGIALAYTFDIPQEQIPENVKDNTIILKISCGFGHDNVSSTDAQRALLNDISVLLRGLSGDRDRKIHLFAAAQASFCIALGKSYMDNAHGTIVLHNYNHEIRGYDWSVQFNRGELIA